jgi:hypothetical protein
MQDAPMSRTRYMQENRKMRFEEAYQGWTGGRLTQTEAAMLLGQCELFTALVASSYVCYALRPVIRDAIFLRLE